MDPDAARAAWVQACHAAALAHSDEREPYFSGSLVFVPLVIPACETAPPVVLNGQLWFGEQYWQGQKTTPRLSFDPVREADGVSIRRFEPEEAAAWIAANRGLRLYRSATVRPCKGCAPFACECGPGKIDDPMDRPGAQAEAMKVSFGTGVRR